MSLFCLVVANIVYWALLLAILDMLVGLVTDILTSIKFIFALSVVCLPAMHVCVVFF